jgi:hypothetical protein
MPLKSDGQAPLWANARLWLTCGTVAWFAGLLCYISAVVSPLEWWSAKLSVVSPLAFFFAFVVGGSLRNTRLGKLLYVGGFLLLAGMFAHVVAITASRH